MYADVMTHSSRCNAALTNEQLVRRAPALFAEQAHDSRSSRYALVPTMPIVNALERVGYRPFDVMAARVRDAGRDGYQKHLIRFRHDSNQTGNDGGVAELILINSHDGTSSYKMMAGWFEFLCSNGMVSGDKAAELTIPHKGNQEAVLRDVTEGARSMLEHMETVTLHRNEWREVSLNPAEQEVFAKAALLTRYEADNVPLRPGQILRPRRRAETGESRFLPKPNLWTTLNVCQEHLLRGGLIGQDVNKRARRQRGINSIDQNVKVNSALWTLATEMAKLKAA